MLRIAAFVVLGLVLSLSSSGAWAGEGGKSTPPDYSFKKPPQPLESLKGVHPRLHFTKERLERLKTLVREDKDYARFLDDVKRIADRGVKSGPPEYIVDDKWSGTEQLWQRSVGEMIPHLALAYCLTGDRKYLDSAKAWMIASCGYKTWGLGDFEGKDLSAGHQLYGIALAYDWLYADLDDETKKTVRESLLKRADYMYKAAVAKEIYWADSYLQNHLWVNITGLAAVGFALYGEADGIDGLINMPLEKYRTTFSMLGDDGASFEGVPYWGYGVEYILKFADLSKGLLGEDLLGGSKWFRNTAYFRLYASLPKNSWTKDADLMSYGDGRRFDWYGPDYLMRRLAGQYKDGHAQWLADAVDEAGVNHPVAQFLNVLWYDSSVAAKTPDDLPLFKVFDDLGVVYMRSDWSGNENLASFKCGPHVGRYVLEKFSEDPGSGHVHPDEGAFQVFAYGDWLMVGSGYTKKTTEYENTLVVNGVGQEGEGHAWFRGDTLMKEKRGAKILRAETHDDLDFVIGDVTAAYGKEAGLRRFVRSFYFLKPSTWVIVDEVETEKPSAFEFFFHSDFAFEKAGPNSYEARGTKGVLQFATLMPGTVSAAAFKQELQGAEGEVLKDKLNTLKVSNREKGSKATFLHVLYACPASETGRAEASVGEAGGRTILTVKTPERTRRFGLDLDRTDKSSSVLREVIVK